MTLRDAYRDLKYLLNRGYRKKSALPFVANHYGLTLEERHLLARCVFPDSWIEEVRRKLLKPEELGDRTIGVDGFNVLITLESILEGRAIICEDGLVRDLKYQGSYRLSERTESLIKEVVGALKGLKVGGAVFFYGKNVPRSGAVKRMTEEALEWFNLPGEVYLVKSPDFELKAFETVATADVGIISKVSHVFDLPRYTGKSLGKRPLHLSEVLGRTQSYSV